MFFVIGGISPKIKVIDDKPMLCPVCGLAQAYFKRIDYYLNLFFIPILIMGCVNIPKNVSPVTGFNIDQYLGTWYEIARLDHSFERGLEKVTAEYSPRDDGGIKVVNKGFDRKKIDGKRRSAKHTLSMIQVLAD